MKESVFSLIQNHSMIDLTHPLNPQVPTWDGSCGFQQVITCNYADCSSKPQFQVQKLEMQAGVGTHMDAPSHCFPNGVSIDQIPLSQLVLPLVVLDVSKKSHAEYRISCDDVLTFEQAHGKIPSGSLVIGYTGWSRFWDAPERYRNADSSGQMHFPCFDSEAAQLLLEREVSGIAIDTLSPDRAHDGTFPVHEIFLGAGKYIIENVANAHLLPPTGALAVVLPMKIAEASEAPVRFIAFLLK